MIEYKGESVDELRKAFTDSVEDYLEFCSERGEEPEKPYSGKFLVRVGPELHKTLVNGDFAHHRRPHPRF